MKLRVLSDIHIEHNMPDSVPDCTADVVILAGDIANGRDGIDWAARAFDMPIIYVPGNHEYYESTFDTVDRLLAEGASDAGKVTLLNGAATVLDNGKDQPVRVIGATWWTDYALYGTNRVDEAMDACARVMVDHRLIATAGDDGQHRAFTPADALQRHRDTTAWLADILAQPFEGKTVVVTHHGPDLGSLDARYAHDVVSAGFLSRRPDLVALADVWIHGHTHTSFDYWIDDSRVVCNPRGYISRRTGAPENPVFDWNKVVEV